MTSRKVDGNKVVDNLVSAASALDPTGASGFILGSIKFILSIRDRVYISKFEKFWSAFEESKIEVDEFIRKTEEQKDWQKVGENFLLVMDSFSAFDKCYYYGKLWVGWLGGKIDQYEFRIMTNILQSMSPAILEKLIYDKPVNVFDMNMLTAWGIFKYSGAFDDPNQDESTEIQNIESRFTNIGEKLVNIIKP